MPPMHAMLILLARICCAVTYAIDAIKFKLDAIVSKPSQTEMNTVFCIQQLCVGFCSFSPGKYKTHNKYFNKIKISIQGTPQMAVDKEARAYRESTHIVIISVPCPYTKCNLP